MSAIALTQAALSLAARPADDGEDAVRALFFSARDGDGAALEALCRLMRPRLFRVAFSVVRDRDEAEDLAQDALVRALEKSTLFLGRGSVTGWMCKVAFNLARNRRRDAGRRKELLRAATSDELDASRADPGARPDEVLRSQRTETRVRAALDELPRRQRDVLKLRLFGELPFADIGLTLGMSEANARVTASQGLARLRLTLADLDPQERPEHTGGAA